MADALVAPLAVSFWCSGGSGGPWRWIYTPYIGVWLLVLLAGGVYVFWHRHDRRSGGSVVRHRLQTRRALQFAAGLLLFAAITDWPLGPLGAGYLASVAMVRFLLISFVVTPLLLLGTPPWLLRRTVGHPRVRPVAKIVLSWPFGMIAFNLVLVVTHLPMVVDTVKVSQIGSFAMDMAWVTAGLLMWWPVLSPLAELPPIRDPQRMLYLFGQSLVPTLPASFLTFSTFPMYRLYELAPPVWLGYDVVGDQRIAGLLMKIGGGFFLWIVIAVIFFRWAGREERGDAQETQMSWEELERGLDRYDLRP